MVTVLIGVALVAIVNDTVAVTAVAPFTLLDITTEGEVRAALKMAGKATLLTPSMLALWAAKVAMETLLVAAAAAATFLSPANWHMIEKTEAAAGVVT